MFFPLGSAFSSTSVEFLEGDLVDCNPPVLQYGSGPFPEFLAKILGADTQLHH
jgi:hypothetical protein